MSEALTPQHPFIASVIGALNSVYGDRFASLGIFGSVARGSARPDSDLDLLIVVAGLPPSRRARFRTFDAVEQRLAPDLAKLAAAGTTTRIAPILRTPEELAIATPLLLDLTEDAILPVDRDGILAGALAALRDRLARAGARRVWVGEQWYWDLKPDFRRGDIVRI